MYFSLVPTEDIDMKIFLFGARFVNQHIVFHFYCFLGFS